MVTNTAAPLETTAHSNHNVTLGEHPATAVAPTGRNMDSFIHTPAPNQPAFIHTYKHVTGFTHILPFYFYKTVTLRTVTNERAGPPSVPKRQLKPMRNRSTHRFNRRRLQLMKATPLPTAENLRQPRYQPQLYPCLSHGSRNDGRCSPIRIIIAKLTAIPTVP